MNNKILDLSNLSDEKFTELKSAVDQWVQAGMLGEARYISSAEQQERMAEFSQALQKAYNQGVNHACIGSAVALLLCFGVYGAVKHFKTKKAKEVETSEIEVEKID